MNRKKREHLILDAAVRVFAREGYSKTSVSEIIDEADVARGTFYLYFKSKKDIFTSLLDRFMMELAQNVAKINALHSHGSIEDLAQHFRDMASDLIQTLTHNRLLAKIILLDSNGLEASFDAKLHLFYDQLAQIIEYNLDNNIKAGIFRTCQTNVVARCMMGSVKEMLSVWIHHDDFELEPSIQGLIDYLLNGLRSSSVLGVDKGMVQEEQKPAERLDVMH